MKAILLSESMRVSTYCRRYSPTVQGGVKCSARWLKYNFIPDTYWVAVKPNITTLN